MALTIDHTRALRRPSDLAELVQAVHDAAEGDEAEWLEWKTDLDLTVAEGRIHLARTILGFANRDPKSAGRFCDGLAYLVLGVEPGNLCGTDVIDPADLENGLAPYLGGALGPAWSPQWVRSDERHILVVTVEAPQPGDRIHSLRKEGPNRYENGTVFIRKVGKTVRADGADLDMLQARLQAASGEAPDLEVVAIGTLPLRWFDTSTTEPQTDEWISRQVKEMLDAAHVVAAEPPVEPDEGAEVAHSASNLGDLLDLSNKTKPDERTLPEFEGAVEEWATEVSDAATSVLLRRYFAGERNAVVFMVTNRSDLNLQDVEVKVHFEGDHIKGLDDVPDTEEMPSRPRAFGQPTPVLRTGLDAFSLDLARINLPSINPGGFLPKRTYIEDGSLHVTFHPGDLRPREQDYSDEVLILLTGTHEPVVAGTWEATAKNWDGVMEGVIDIGVQPEPVSAAELLDTPDDRP